MYYIQVQIIKSNDTTKSTINITEIVRGDDERFNNILHKDKSILITIKTQQRLEKKLKDI